METRELKLKFFHNAIDRFFNIHDISKLNNLQTILNIGANLLNNSEEDYEYLLNAFSEIANKRMGIGTEFFKNCLLDAFIREGRENE